MTTPHLHQESKNENAVIAKSMKRKSQIKPFRIKTSSIVAVRYKPPPPQHSRSQSHFIESWLDPVPGRDVNYNLVGKVIRCMFPKNYWSKSCNGKNPKNESIERNLEGEIVSIHQGNKGLSNGFKVKLLIDKESITKLTFLKERMDDDYGDASNISKAEKRKRVYEEKIRGKNKVIVNLNLAELMPVSSLPSSKVTTHSSSNGNGHHHQDQDQDLPPVKWVIRKWVPITDTQPQLIGDKNDDIAQKEKNFRWSSTFYQYDANRLNHDYYLVGEVIKMDLNLANIGTSNTCAQDQDESLKRKRGNSEDNTSSLATVTVKRMILPEVTHCGRLAYHHRNEIFHIDHDSNANDHHGEQNSSENKDTPCPNSTFMVPIEDLIVIGRKLHHLAGVISVCNDGEKIVKDLSLDDNDFFVRYTYNTKGNEFNPFQHGDGNNDQRNIDLVQNDNGIQVVCHRCRRKSNRSNMILCSHTHLSIINDMKSESNWWCNECCQILNYSKEKTKDWFGPCCLGVCDCNFCKSRPVKRTINDFIRELILDKKVELLCTTCSCVVKDAYSCPQCSRKMHHQCYKWETFLREKNVFQRDDNYIHTQSNDHSSNIDTAGLCFHCCKNKISKDDRKAETVYDIDIDTPPKTSLMSLTKSFVDKSPSFDFELPFNFLESEMNKYQNILSLPTKRARKKKKKVNDESYLTSSSKASILSPKQEGEVEAKVIIFDEEKLEVEFKPTCARCCDTIVRRNGVRQTNNSAAHAARSLASIRRGGKKTEYSEASGGEKVSQTISSGRAARANQRRRNKDFEGLGLEQTKNMAGREDVLRFGKSLIHGWGVFTDGKIKAGDLIVEYRGVLIGNIVADKREKEYENAKIGSDYMFRIDSGTVCDATHHGNVARFINASCTPNCYTQIISLNGSKRIAIYAKKDIEPGEELSYDYKFQTEFDESKRIPCNCGTADCRGFMNWDKKYVAIPTTSKF